MAAVPPTFPPAPSPPIHTLRLPSPPRPLPACPHSALPRTPAIPSLENFLNKGVPRRQESSVILDMMNERLNKTQVRRHGTGLRIGPADGRMCFSLLLAQARLQVWHEAHSAVQRPRLRSGLA